MYVSVLYMEWHNDNGSIQYSGGYLTLSIHDNRLQWMKLLRGYHQSFYYKIIHMHTESYFCT
jgi:hypothetical protein